MYASIEGPPTDGAAAGTGRRKWGSPPFSQVRSLLGAPVMLIPHGDVDCAGRRYGNWAEAAFPYAEFEALESSFQQCSDPCHRPSRGVGRARCRIRPSSSPFKGLVSRCTEKATVKELIAPEKNPAASSTSWNVCVTNRLTGNQITLHEAEARTALWLFRRKTVVWGSFRSHDAYA